ncbi:M48 family metallopeptidase [Metabacillus litoralis]|uniref:M48 family metallopeptidase n=1 Tax=Metabacillus litoralis TaxID=152268 RepID=UPI000EF619AB|nr:M48 family metallopeptidase [Metabacillus litoralis]
MESNYSLVHKHEDTMFILCVLSTFFLAIYLLLSIVGIIIFLAIAVLSIFSHIISMSHIQLNGVRLRESQFPELYQKVSHLVNKMEMETVPEVYIVESGGLLNAFATKVLAISGKNMIVLYSDFVDIAEEAEDFDIDYVIAHELAHLKRNHVVKSAFLSLSMWIPFIGTGYLRSAEYICDRMAAYYTEKPESAINGLLVLAAGRRLYNKVNVEDYLKQYNEKRGFFTTLTELLSTHPPLSKRIYEIETFSEREPSITLLSRTKMAIIIMIIVFLLIPIAIAGGAVGATLLAAKFNFLSDVYPSEYSPLMQAIIDDDMEEVQSLLEDGADPNEVNEYGENPLIVAISYERHDYIPFLVEAGADPNLQDDYGWTPLIQAVMMEDVESGRLLLEAGADPALEDVDGLTAIDHATDLGYTKFVELLTQYK